MRFKHIKDVLSTKKYGTTALIAFGIFSGLVLYFTNLELNVGNFGKLAYAQFTTDLLIAATFGIFLALFIFNYDNTRKISGKTGFVGGALGALFFGCTACSITLAGYLGIAGFISFFPFYGFELKILSLSILVFSIAKLSNTTCKIK